MSRIATNDVTWTCPKYKRINIDALKNVDFEPQMCRGCGCIFDIYYKLDVKVTDCVCAGK